MKIADLIGSLTSHQMGVILMRRPGDEPATDDELRETIRQLYRLCALDRLTLEIAARRIPKVAPPPQPLPAPGNSSFH
jgi:hypothetical protein